MVRWLLPVVFLFWISWPHSTDVTNPNYLVWNSSLILGLILIIAPAIRYAHTFIPRKEVPEKPPTRYRLIGPTFAAAIFLLMTLWFSAVDLRHHLFGQPSPEYAILYCASSGFCRLFPSHPYRDGPPHFATRTMRETVLITLPVSSECCLR